MNEKSCGFRWKAPHLLAPGTPREVVVPEATIPVHGDRIYVEQECLLERGHDGPHRSLTNVTLAADSAAKPEEGRGG